MKLIMFLLRVFDALILRDSCDYERIKSLNYENGKWLDNDIFKK